jgi:hypothetical protein
MPTDPQTVAQIVPRTVSHSLGKDPPADRFDEDRLESWNR